MKKFDATGRRWHVAAIAMMTAALFYGGAKSASAQKLPTATAIGLNVDVGGGYSVFHPEYPQQTLGGADLYVDVNVKKFFGLEGEGRWLRQNQASGSHQTTYLIGPRVQVHYGRFAPYAKALVGNGNLVFPYPDLGYGNYLVVAGAGGLDINLSPKLKLRLIDFEYQDWPKFSFGSISPYGVSAGFSYQVYHSGGWPKHHYKK